MRTRIFALLLLLSPALVGAIEVTDLYQMDIPVADQNRSSRIDAYRSALTQILVRVSGQGDVMLNRNMQAALDDVVSYVQSYRYRKLDPQQAIAQGLAGAQLVLQVQMDPEAIRRLLRSNQLPIWGSARPGLVAWVALDQAGKHELLGAAAAHPARELLARQAGLRGQPLQFPLLDLADQAAINVEEVWAGATRRVQAASSRYNNDAVLYGKVYQSNNLWVGEWHLLLKDQEQVWRLEGRDLAGVLRPTIDVAVDAIASRYAQTTANVATGYTLVRVWNVKNLGDYAKVMAYLSELVSVTEVVPDTVEAGSVLFRVRTEGAWDQVGRSITLGTTLYPYQPEAESPAPTVATVPVVHYRYLP